MLYKLLGLLVWNGGKVLLRRGTAPYVPKPSLAGAVAVVGRGRAGRLASKRNGSED